MAKKLGKPNSRGLYRTEKGEEVIYLGTEEQEAERRGGRTMAKRGKRDRGKETFWRRSGLGIRAFCAERGLAEASFFAWRRIIAEPDREAAAVRGQRGDHAGNPAGAANGTPSSCRCV